jgi:PAS domain S-box-containing protein
VSAATPAPDPRDGPADGDVRVAAVRRLETTALGSGALQRLAALAMRLLEADSAQISLLGDVETVVGGAGLPPGTVGRQVALDESLCALTAAGAPEPVVIPDTGAAPHVAGLTAVTEGRAGAFLGMPLLGSDRTVVGAVCVFGARPRSWTDADVALLRQLADSVATELELSALAKEFEASRLRFDLAIDAAGIGSFDFDVDTGTLTWDERLIELFGYGRDSFEGTIDAFFARLHPDDVARTRDAMQAAIDTRGVLDVEYRIVLPTGETRWVQGRGRTLSDDSGVAVRLLGAAYDTTRQRHGDARVARVLESMSAAFYSLDREWRFSYVNAEAERLIGRSRDELLGRTIWELYPAAVGSSFESEFRTAVSSGETRVFEAYYPAPLDGWYELRAWPSPDGLSIYFLDITERRTAEERARRSAARLELLAEVSALMSANLGSGVREDAASLQVAAALVPELGDWAVVTLLEDDGRVRDVGSWHADADFRPIVARYVELRLSAYQPTPEVLQGLRSGQIMALPDVTEIIERTHPPGESRELLDRLAPRSAAMLPLAARGRVLGAVNLYRGHDRAPMDAEDLAVAKDVADRAALAVDNTRLYEQQRRLAEELQRSLLTAPPQPDHGEIVVRYRPAMEVAQVGGDWYDAFLQPSGATVLVIGDVVGHDTEAAAAMGQLRGMLRGIAYRAGITPAEVLTELDAAIHGLGMGTMATAAIARIEQTPEERDAGVVRLRWSNAGHPPPLLMHDDGRIEELAGARAELMLGVEPTARRTDSVVTVARGSTLLLYTDGLVEGRDLPLDEGIARLRSVLTELADEPLAVLCDAVIERLRPEGLQDDVALVAIRLHEQDRPRPPEAGPEKLPPGID